jgi:hypothetical protein
VSPKSNIIMVIMVFTLLRNTGIIVKGKDNLNLSLELVLNTKMHVLRGLSKQSCVWHGLSWSMPHSIGQIVDQMIFLSGPLR